jgi:hypothetical protein
MKRILCLLVLFTVSLFSLSGCVSGATSIDSESNDQYTPGTVVNDPPANWDGQPAPEDLFQSEDALP